jgi:hypothetical protein
MREGMAKAIPMLPPEGERIWELMPTSWPVVLTRAPPELPWLMGASVCRKSSKLPSPSPVARPLADDAHGHGLSNAQRVAEGQDHVAHAHRVRVAKRKRGKARRLDLQDREVTGSVRAHHLGGEAPAVGELDADLLRAVHHVVVREHVTVGADDHARAQSPLAPRLRVGNGEAVLAEERDGVLVSAEGQRRGLGQALRAHGHDRRCDARHEVGVSAGRRHRGDARRGVDGFQGPRLDAAREAGSEDAGGEKGGHTGCAQYLRHFFFPPALAAEAQGPVARPFENKVRPRALPGPFPRITDR